MQICCQLVQHEARRCAQLCTARITAPVPFNSLFRVAWIAALLVPFHYRVSRLPPATSPWSRMAASASGSRSVKVVLVGDAAVGKSCIAVQLQRGEFYDFSEPTIGAAFVTKEIELPEGTISMEIWDTAGQERYRSLAPLYYRNANAALVVYDVTNQESFDGAKRWVNELKRQGDPGTLIAIAGNKCDRESERQVKADEAREFAEQDGLVFMETSAKTGTNVKEIFEEMARRLPRDEKDTDGVDFGAQPDKPSGGCCS